MRHNHKGRKFGRNKGHRRSLIMNLVKAIIQHESIETTLPKAKDIRPVVEKLITKGRNPSLHTKRQIAAFLGNDMNLADKIVSVLSVRYANRTGGYSRITKIGPRQGDAAQMAIFELVKDEATAAA